MPTDLNNTKSVNTIAYKQEQLLVSKVNTWKNVINNFQMMRGAEPIAFNTNEIVNNFKSQLNEKSFNGTSSATGDNLINDITNPLLASTLTGGAFIRSGANYAPNYRGNAKLNGVVSNDGYADQVLGTPSTNEISLFSGDDITLAVKTAFIQGAESILARNLNPAQIIAECETLLEEEKLVLADTLAAAAITGNASSVAINPTGLPTYGTIHVGMNKMIGNLSKYSIRGQRPVFYMTHGAFAALISEQDAQGRFQDSQYQFRYSTVDQTIPASGQVGTYGGYALILVGSESNKSILGTYTVSASGVISAQTGGSSTAILFGVPLNVTIIRNSEFDYTTLFDGRNDRDAFLNGEVTIGARTHMGAGVSIPTRWNYFAITV